MRSLATILLNVLTKGVALSSLTEKNEKFNSSFSDDERDDLINNTEDTLLSFISSNINNISSEIKALQRSIAIMKQDLPKILRDELITIKGGL